MADRKIAKAPDMVRPQLIIPTVLPMSKALAPLEAQTRFVVGHSTRDIYATGSGKAQPFDREGDTSTILGSSSTDVEPGTVRPAFTLLELLVIITLLVVLLALLAPALDSAICQAQLARCGANLHGIASGVLSYAVDHKREYPGAGRSVFWTAQYLNEANEGSFDLRQIIRSYLQVDRLFLDPLAGNIDLSIEANGKGIRTDSGQPGQGTRCLGNYSWYMRWGYPAPDVAMNRLGQRFSWNGDSFDVLAADVDTRHEGGWALSGHPDADAAESFYRVQDAFPPGWVQTVPGRYTLSWWQNSNGKARGLIDNNYLIQDGSVARLNAVLLSDPRMALVPDIMNLTESLVRRVQLPPARR